MLAVAKLTFTISPVIWTNDPDEDSLSDGLAHLQVPDDSSYNPDNVVTTKESNSVIHKTLLRCLTDRERIVIEKRFGLNGYRETTLGDIGKPFNITREMVRKIEGKALRKLKVKAIHNNLDFESLSNFE